jgi:hypothetical protein
MSINTNPQFLFIASPNRIVEHPLNLPDNPKEIPDGPIKGWLCFAPNHHGNPHEFIGPFQAVVTRPYDDKQPCIEVSRGEYSKSQYWYDHPAFGECKYHPKRPCWQQSNSTLRFIREVRISHVRFEYDVNYSGGNYSDTGKFALVSADLVRLNGPKTAFQQTTGHLPCHIIHYTLEELYDQHGERMEETVSDFKQDEIMGMICCTQNYPEAWKRYFDTLNTNEQLWTREHLSEKLWKATGGE